MFLCFWFFAIIYSNFYQISSANLDFKPISLQNENDISNITKKEKELINLYDKTTKTAQLSNLMGVLMLMKKNLTVESIYYFRESCEIDKYKNVGYILNYVQTSFDYLMDVEKNYTSAFEMLINIIDYAPNTYEIWKLLIDLLIQIQSKKESIPFIINNSYENILRRGLSIFPNCPGLLYFYGIYYFEQNNFQCALLNIGRAISKKENLFSPINTQYFIDTAQSNYNFILNLINSNNSNETIDDLTLQREKYCFPPKVFMKNNKNFELMWINKTTLNFDLHSDLNTSIGKISDFIKFNQTLDSNCQVNDSCYFYSLHIGFLTFLFFFYYNNNNNKNNYNS
jgi:hypothetical protein